MSIYGKKWTIDGVPFGFAQRVGTESYKLRFERDEGVSIEDVEGINWARPQVVKLGDEECPLPAGGFALGGISYDSNKRMFEAYVQLQREYYGDVSAYVEELKECKTELMDTEKELMTERIAKNAMAETIESQNATLEQQTATISRQNTEIETLNAALAEADETIISLYEAQNTETEA